MRNSGLFVALVAITSICGADVARAQDCKCAGSLIGAAPYVGGDGQPLKWLYAPYLVSSPPPPDQKLICYMKEVDNKTNSDVRDVRWEVANFFRRIVAKNSAPASCPQVAGDTKPAPTNGPLNFGPSSEAYDTTVLQPKDGWGATASNSSGRIDGKGGGFRVADGRIDTTVTLSVDDGSGKVVPARLVFTTTAKSDGNKTNFTYSVANESEVTLAVLVNLSATSAVLEQVPMLQRPLSISGGGKATFNASAEGKTAIEQAAIVVFDRNRNIDAIDSAGFYTVPGKKEVPDESFWQRLR